MGSPWKTQANSNTGGGGGFEKCPPGNHPAVLVGLIDMGNQWSDGYQGAPGKWQHRLYFVWEIDEKISGTNRNHVMAVDLTNSLNKKARLRAWVEAWLGKAIPDGLEYDVSELLGKGCLLNVQMNNNYPKVTGVSQLPKNTPVHAHTYPLTLLSLDDIKAGKTIPEWVPWLFGRSLLDHIKECQEWGGQPGEPAPRPIGGHGPTPAPDKQITEADIPF